VRNALAT